MDAPSRGGSEIRAGQFRLAKQRTGQIHAVKRQPFEVRPSEIRAMGTATLPRHVPEIRRFPVDSIRDAILHVDPESQRVA